MFDNSNEPKEDSDARIRESQRLHHAKNPQSPMKPSHFGIDIDQSQFSLPTTVATRDEISVREADVTVNSGKNVSTLSIICIAFLVSPCHI